MDSCELHVHVQGYFADYVVNIRLFAYKNTDKSQACLLYVFYIKACFELSDVESNTMWTLLISQWFLYSMYILKWSIKTRKNILLKMKWKHVTPNLNLLPSYVERKWVVDCQTMFLIYLDSP